MPEIKDSQRASIKWILNNLQEELRSPCSSSSHNDLQATHFYFYCFFRHPSKGIVVELTIELIFNWEHSTWSLPEPLSDWMNGPSTSSQPVKNSFIAAIASFLLLGLFVGASNSSIRGCLWPSLRGFLGRMTVNLNFGQVHRKCA